MSEKKLFDKKVAADDMSSDFPVLKPKSKPHGFGLERRSKGAERMVLSIPREIESAGAKRTLLRRGV